MLTQNDVPLLFRDGLIESYLDELPKWDPVYSQIAKQSSTDKPEQRAAIMTGLSRLAEIGDGEPVTFDKPRMSDVVQGLDREWGGGFAVTLRTVEDDQYGKANQGAKWLANAVHQTLEYRVASVLDDAFTGAVYRGIDNLPLISAAHTLIGSPNTVRNTPVNVVGFGITAYTQAMQLAQDMKDENGDPCRMWPTKLIMGNDAVNYNRALQVMYSDNEPFTANRQDNATRRRLKLPEPILNPYMLNTKHYFFVDDSKNDLNLVIRRKATYTTHNDFFTGAFLNKVTMRFLIWFVLWRGWLGFNPSV